MMLPGEWIISVIQIDKSSSYMLTKPVQTSAFWKDLSAYCQKSAPGKRAREGRELIIPLPNEFSKEIPPEDIANAFRSLLEQETGTRWAIALHWNKTKQSYHLHAVGSENPEVRENDVTPESVKPRKPLKRDTYF